MEHGVNKCIRDIRQFISGWVLLSALTVPMTSSLMGSFQPVFAAELFAGVSSIQINDVRSSQIQLQFQSDMPFEYRVKVLDNDRIALKLYNAKLSSQLRGPQLNSSYTLLNLSPSKLVKQGTILNPFPGMADDSTSEEIVLQGPGLGKKSLKVSGATLRPEEPLIVSPPPALAKAAKRETTSPKASKSSSKPVSKPATKTTSQPSESEESLNLLSYDAGSDTSAITRPHNTITSSSISSSGPSSTRFVDMGADDDREETKRLTERKKAEEEKAKARRANQEKPSQQVLSKQSVLHAPSPEAALSKADPPSQNPSERTNAQNRLTLANKEARTPRTGLEPRQPQWREVGRKSTQVNEQVESHTERWPAPTQSRPSATSRPSEIDGPTTTWNASPGRLKVTPGAPAFFQPYAMAPDSIIQLSPTGSRNGQGDSGSASTKSSDSNRVIYKPIPKYQGGAPPISFTISTTGETVTLPSAPITGGYRQPAKRIVSKPSRPQDNTAVNALAYINEPVNRPAKASSITILKQAMTMVKQNQSQEAIALLEEGIQKDPNNAALYAAVGESYIKADNLHQANLAYEKASRLTPEGTYDDRYAYVLYKQGNRKKAIQVLLNLLQLNPGNAKHQFMVGTLYQELGQSELALPYLRAAERLNPSSSDVQYNLGLAYEQYGQKDLAKRHYQKALEISPGSRDLQEALNRLRT